MKQTTLHRINALVLTITLTLSGPVSLAQKSGGKKAADKSASGLTAQQKVTHLLNRITFGARPGEVDRVLKLGWEKFLDEQLHPERLSDDLVKQKLKTVPSATLSAEQIASTYPPPQIIRQRLQARGIDYKEFQADKKELKAQNKAAQQKTDSEASTPMEAQPTPAAEMSQEELRKQREEIRAIMKEMGWKPQQAALMEAQQAKVLRAVYSERQLQEVLTDFWFNHFNVFAGKGPSRMFITPYERDVIRPHVFSKFEDLLRATAKSPAMLFYLDNWQSMSPNARQPEMMRRYLETVRAGNRRPDRFDPASEQDKAVQQMDRRQQNQLQRRSRGINENYAREIMELHTLGVDGGYTQKDVQEVARCFTGWTIRQLNRGGEFQFAAWMHDDGEKVVLGKKIPAGGGINDGEAVIKMLAHHSSTAKFIATKLARKFVSDNPPQSLIDRTAQVFLKTDGDLREVVRSILTSPEFWSATNYRAKIKTPFELTVSAVRVLGADTNGSPAFHRWIAQMGEPLYLMQPPTGYKDDAETWVNTGALLQRMNFALALNENRIPGTRVNSQSLPDAVNSSKPEQIVDQVIQLMLSGEVSSQTRATLSKQLNNPTNENGAAMMIANYQNTSVARIVGLVLGSPEFQRQ